MPSRALAWSLSCERRSRLQIPCVGRETASLDVVVYELSACLDVYPWLCYVRPCDVGINMALRVLGSRLSKEGGSVCVCEVSE